MIAQDEKDTEAAITEFKRLSEFASDKNIRLKALNNLGNTYLELGQLNKARQILEETLEEKIATGGHDLIPTYNNLAKIEMKENNRSEAKAYLKQAANDINSQINEENVWTLNSLITLHEEDQNQPQLLIYYKQHVNLLSPLVKLYEELKILNQQYAAWKLKFEYDQAEERYEVAIQKFTYKIIIISSVVIILVVAYFMLLYKKKHQRLHTKLKDSWERMRKKAIESAAESRKILEEMGYKPGHFKGELPRY